MDRQSKARDSFYRSEEMCLAQLFLQAEAAYQCVAELGELGLVQFRDLNVDMSPFQRKYVSEVRRCDEMERKLRYLECEIQNDRITLLDSGENTEAPLPREMVDLEATLEKLENELEDVNRNEKTLRKNYSELIEFKYILKKAQTFFEEVEQDRLRSRGGNQHNNSDQEILITTAIEDDESLPVSSSLILQMKLGFIAGVIQRQRLPAFERLLWRVCRGNVFLRTSEIDEVLKDTLTGEAQKKTAFIIFFQGDQLKTKVKKICEGFRATLYPCPDTLSERREMAVGLMTRMEDLKIVLGQTQDHRHRVLLAASKNLRIWVNKVCKLKSIYHILNMCNFDVTQKCLIAEVWCPIDDLERIKLALKRGTEESGSHIPSILHRMETTTVPPTYHKVDKFTCGFQNIVDSYGIATYREINPAPYTAISFPFLFAVMFGDMGHGLIVLLAALFLILKEKEIDAAKVKDEIFQTFHNGRYIIALMGVFSLYTGLLYNDMFSKSLNVFGSSWKNYYNVEKLDLLNPDQQLMLVPELGYYMMNCSQVSPGPYPIGVDPVWNLAESNKLTFLNSMKMKSSVILGIVQMAFGLILSYQNHKYFKSELNTKFMFAPQIVFLSCIFVYLCIQIVVKWLFFNSGGCPDQRIFGYKYPGSSCAPSILVGLISMFMFKSRDSGFMEVDGSTKDLCYLNFWYPGQFTIEILLLLTAIACVPVMLCVKPYLLWREDIRKRTAIYRQLSVRADLNDEDVEVIYHEHGRSSINHEEEKLNIGDEVIFQVIHTVEFVLGCISHTASYLRLWALSLAHSQLSDVLWRLFRQSFVTNGYIGAVSTYIFFCVFFTFSILLLVLMEGLSSFLHALRLHWVEFQSKFYGGCGHAFTPFSFDKLMEEKRCGEKAA